MIYDSGSPPFVSRCVEMAICSIFRPQAEFMNFDIIDVQCQPNGWSDCGLFAIAFATELVHGHDPATSHFDTTSLRQHLMDGLEKSHLSRFTSTKRKVGLGKRVRKFHKEQIYCVCRTVNDPERPMLQCSSCKRWYHHDCVDIQVGASRKIKFICSLCSDALQKLAEWMMLYLYNVSSAIIQHQFCQCTCHDQSLMFMIFIGCQ